ncbi:MAG: peptidylprolyl isomerase [Oscillospiraceae bacterium]|jgi:peptidyl-prolyl cis-trans isomerase B (cyclophilin B)|nr:peptidylprolyl isomerase [Oscillospiraceae bacterium]
MEKKTKAQKIVKIILIICVIALILSVTIFNFYSCTTNSGTYVDMTDANVLQVSELKVDNGGVSEGTGVATTEGTESGTSSTETDNTEKEYIVNIPAGSPIAIIETSVGTLKARLYPEYAPKTVENFTRLANGGYYNNTYIYRVQPQVYCAVGSENPDGSTENKYDVKNERVPIELSPSLWAFKGSLMAIETYTDNNFFDVLLQRTKTYTGSQFIICGSVEFTDDFIAELKETTLPDVVKEGFINLGGVPNYSQKLAVFAQTYEGFDVLDKILNVAVTDGENLQPKEDIKILNVTISTY